MDAKTKINLSPATAAVLQRFSAKEKLDLVGWIEKTLDEVAAVGDGCLSPKQVKDALEIKQWLYRRLVHERRFLA